MMAELDDADKMLLRKSLERLQTANEIVRFVSDFFRDKYGLTPDNQVTADGRIISVASQSNGLGAADAFTETRTE